MPNIENDLNKVEEIIGYDFLNKDLLIQAFTRKSWAMENGGLFNEELEFIGDSSLDLAVIKLLHEYYGVMTKDNNDKNYDFKGKGNQFFFKEHDEGELTKVKSIFVQKNNLANRIEELDLEQYLKMGRGDEISHKENEPSIKEDLFEAIVGAVTVDSEYDFFRIVDVVRRMLDFDNAMLNGFITTQIDYVNKVQEFFQKNFGIIPQYTIQPYGKEFWAHCLMTINGRKHSFNGYGKSKSLARKLCAKDMYDEITRYNSVLNTFLKVNNKIDFDNPIGTLNEFSQKRIITDLNYTFSKHDDLWLCICDFIYNKQPHMGTSNGPSKAAAKTVAAGLALNDAFKK